MLLKNSNLNYCSAANVLHSSKFEFLTIHKFSLS